MAVRKRKDRNSWLVDIVISGRRIRESYKTKREALARERELIAQEVTGTFSSTSLSDVTFQEFAPHYLEWAELNKRRKTFQDERWRLRANLLPFFGRYKISQIDVRLIERYKMRRQRDGVTSRTVNLELTLLSVMFRRAVEWGYARDNPVAKVPRLREEKKPPRYLSEQEIGRLLEAATGTYLYPLIVTALHTGMRKSELFYLRWNDIDFEANTITIQPHGSDGFTTKNYGYRTLEMTDELRAVLRDVECVGEYVFTYNRQPIRWSVDKTFRSICRKAGIENCTLHTLRHTFASHLAMQGVPLMHIQQLLGHKDYDTTLAYAHLSRESLRGQVHKPPYGNTGP